MARYQQTVSVILMLASAIGIFAIGRIVLFGGDSIGWMALGLMFALAWLARRMILRAPVTSEASLRLDDAPAWTAMSPGQRRLMMVLDWPLFLEIRKREVLRLFSEPLVSVRFKEDDVTLVPLEAPHSEPYFLRRIASAAAGHGLEIGNLTQAPFGARLNGQRVILRPRGSDLRLWDYLRREVGDRDALPLNTFVEAREAGHLGTLTPAERNRYFMDRR